MRKEHKEKRMKLVIVLEEYLYILGIHYSYIGGDETFNCTALIEQKCKLLLIGQILHIEDDSKIIDQ